MKPLILILFALPLQAQHVGIENYMLDLPIDKTKDMEKFKWCIERTPENADEVNEWANKRYSLYVEEAYYYFHSERVGGLFLHPHIQPDFHEITIHEFRLLTDPEFTYGVIFEKPEGFNGYTYTDKSGMLVTCSDVVADEISRMFEEQSHYSSQPEVTTTLDPITEYKVKGPDGNWSFMFENETNCEAVKKATQEYAENLKDKLRKRIVLAKLNTAIKAQKKALRELKELRDQLNAETNY